MVQIVSGNPKVGIAMIGFTEGRDSLCYINMFFKMFLGQKGVKQRKFGNHCSNIVDCQRVLLNWPALEQSCEVCLVEGNKLCGLGHGPDDS